VGRFDSDRLRNLKQLLNGNIERSAQSELLFRQKGMPYVPPEVKERIKREVSIQRLAEARGIKLTRSGKELIGLCPFHDDRNPQPEHRPGEECVDCKGACGEGGDVILWVMRAEGMSFHHALELLKRNYAPSAGPVVKIARCGSCRR
jgi:hypothetical protein